MTAFLRRVTSHRALSRASPDEEATPLLTIHVSQQPASRSLSGSLSAPELSCRKQQHPQHPHQDASRDLERPTSTEPLSRAACPRRMHAAAMPSMRHARQLALAFISGGSIERCLICRILLCQASECKSLGGPRDASCNFAHDSCTACLAGGLLTCLCVALLARAGARLGFIAATAPSELAAPLALCSRQHDAASGLPSGWGASPLTLSNQTGDAHATPDRLIVAVHHAEVR